MAIDRKKYLAAEEMALLRDTTEARAKGGTDADRLTWLCVDLALQTGLRVGELALLTVGDIDLRARAVTVWRTKRRKPTREVIGMSESMHSHVRSHLSWLAKVDRRQSLWEGKRGAWTKRGLQQAWQRACKRAGLPPITIHGARHTMAVHLYRQTKDLRTVQKQLGHTSPDTTAEFYADVPFEDQLDALDQLFG